MIIGGQELYNDLKLYRLVSIVGFRGAGKDLLSTELAIPFLRRGYKFYSNQLHVWNDKLWIDNREKYLERYRNNIRYPNWENIPELPLYPDIRSRVVVLSEAGRYLRQYTYFQDLLEFARKVDSYFLFPSVRESHEDLMKMAIYPISPFQRLVGFKGGLWGWAIQDGYNPKRVGKFWFFPWRWIVGTYDTSDFTEEPSKLLEVVRKEIELDQIARNRDGIQGVGDAFTSTDEDHQRAIMARVEQFTLAVSRKEKKSRR